MKVNVPSVMGILLHVWKSSFRSTFSLGGFMIHPFKTSSFQSLSNLKKGSWLVSRYIRDEILPRYVEIIINHDKDPY